MIKILAHVGSDNTIANTARLSMTQAITWNMLPIGYTEEQRDKLIRYLAKHEHSSPFRHTSITLHMQIPVFLARQLGKHQVGMSWNEGSRRYIDEEPEFYYPDEWRKRPEGNIKQGSAGVLPDNRLIMDSYDNLVQYCKEEYNEMIRNGVAPEQARMVLPQSMMIEVIWTGSLMAFAHVYNLRSKEGAQIEAQEFASELKDKIAPLYPVAWEALTGE